MSVCLHIATFPGTFHLAVTQQEQLVDFRFWWLEHTDDIGAIFEGIVKKIARSMGGVFVDLGNGHDGFLPLSTTSPLPHEGEHICVRIIRMPHGGKGCRLTLSNYPKTGKTGCIQPAKTLLERLNELWHPRQIIVDSPRALAIIPPFMRPLCQKGFSDFSDSLKDDIASLMEAEIQLTNQIKAIVTPTPALTAIDMDLKPDHSSHGKKQQLQFTHNVQALPILCRQITLRNLCGAIIIDPAGLSIKNRRKLVPVIEDSLKKDPLKPKCLGVTRLGFIEIVRKRIFPPLQEQYTSPYGITLRILRKLITDDAHAHTLKASRQVIHILKEMKTPVQEAIAQRRKPFTLEIEPTWPLEKWEAI